MLSPRTMKKIHSLRELHLTPHFIYLVNKKDFEPDNEYVLEIWKGKKIFIKDNTKIGVIDDMIKRNSNDMYKHLCLQFQKVRLVFDVQALFQQKSQASITLKLTEKSLQQQKQTIIDEFHLHILFYSYEFSKNKFVRHKQNSVGKISNYILNYSFSAIYGQRTESLLFRKHEKRSRNVLLEDIYLTKKDSKYGLILRDEEKKKDLNTIFLIQQVAQKSIMEMNYSADVEDNPESAFKKYLSSENIEEPENEQDGLQNVRKAARSILDDVAMQKDDSTLTETDLLEQIRMKSKKISTLLLIIISSYLIFYLMHPNKKI